MSSFHTIIEKGVLSIGLSCSSVEENKYSIVIDQKAMNNAWAIEMYNGMSKELQ